MPRKSPRISQSQPSTSQGGKRQKSSRQTNGEVSALSQSTLDQHLICSQTDFKDMVNDCVRYFVNNAGHSMYFRRADIQKHCAPKAGQQLQQVIEKTAETLKNVYGYNLLVCDPSERSSKAYIVSNAMPYTNYNVNREETDPKNAMKILLLLILSHIFMSNFSISEASLYSFLSQLQIETNKRHPLFGQVKDYIMNTLVKQKYLQMETDPVSKKITFSWGVRAEKEISKHEVLKFVCKVYKDHHQPKSWTNQYKNAQEQGFENDKLFEENAMDTD